MVREYYLAGYISFWISFWIDTFKRWDEHCFKPVNIYSLIFLLNLSTWENKSSYTFHAWYLFSATPNAIIIFKINGGVGKLKRYIYIYTK